RGHAPWCDVTSDDFNFDGCQEVQLAGNHLIALFEPSQGGRMYELDVREIAHNLLATLSRRTEAYHHKVLAGPTGNGEEMASIHDRVVFKQEGLDRLLQYDNYARKSLVDHFYAVDTKLDDVASNSADELGGFVEEAYRFEIGQDEAEGVEGAYVVLRRKALVDSHEISISKRISMAAGCSVLDVAYLVEGLPVDHPLHFAVEWNFSGMPAGIDDRYFYDAQHNRLGQLGEQLDLQDTSGVGLVDEWLGIDVGLACDRPTRFWTFPIQTVSQSEAGFEAVHQSVVVMPHWLIRGDESGRWGVSMQLSVSTALAEQRTADRQIVGSR
ncbi:MAG: DUF1926 domain-containing protein, partial [Planctomycetales bacterium]